MEWRKAILPGGGSAYIKVNGETVIVATAYCDGFKWAASRDGKPIAEGWSRVLEQIDERLQRRKQREA